MSVNFKKLKDCIESGKYPALKGEFDAIVSDYKKNISDINILRGEIDQYEKEIEYCERDIKDLENEKSYNLKQLEDLAKKLPIEDQLSFILPDGQMSLFNEQ